MAFDPALDLPPGSPAACDVHEGRLSMADAAYLTRSSWLSRLWWRIEFAWWYVRNPSYYRNIEAVPRKKVRDE